MTSAMIYLGDRLGLYRALAERRAADERGARAHDRALRALAARVAAPAGRCGRARAPRRRPLRALARRPTPCSRTRAIPRSARVLLAAAADDRVSRAAARGVPQRHRAPLRRASVRKARAASSAASRRGSARCSCRSRCRALEGVVARSSAGTLVRRRRLRRGRRADRDGEGLPELASSTATTSRTTRSRAPRRTARAAGVDNVHFHDARARSAARRTASFGFVTTFDCLHDMTDPARRSMRASAARCAPDGTWLIADIKAHASYEENVAKNPMAAMMYGTSVISCMSSALSEPGGLGLGTLGLPRGAARADDRARPASRASSRSTSGTR